MASLLTLKILDGYSRPVVLLEKKVTCLIDTGADTPVWTKGSAALERTFKAERIEGKKFLLSGFGREPEIADAYRVFDLTFKGDDDEACFVFRSMTVACTSRPSIIANLIIPATAFSHMNYTIRNIGVEQPVVEIEHEGDEYVVASMYSKKDNRFIERVFSFANE